jgi:hypothetical protein
VAFYFWAYERWGQEAVKFMIDDPNVHIEYGYVGARMYVYGSLIFILGGLVAAPQVIPNAIVRWVLIGCCVAVALTSARSGLMLAVPIGALLGALHGITSKQAGRAVGRLFVRGIGVVLVVSLVGWALNEMYGIDIMLPLENTLEKLSTGGGEERSTQFMALLEGVSETMATGAGHGMGVRYYVNELTPWRYEMVWIASVFRVGVIGAIIYAIPFVLALYRGWRPLLRGQLSIHERFMYGGFVCAFFASNTNPYIEAIVFQWMYVLPVVYFLDEARRNTAAATHAVWSNRRLAT